MRDGRGHPGRYALKNQPKLKLSDLLKRRRMTLEQFLAEFGITAYETLSNRCDRMGVVPPTREEFTVVIPEPINSPQEGVVVLEPLPLADGEPSPIETWEEQPWVGDASPVFGEAPSALQQDEAPKKHRKRKGDTQE